MKCVFVLILLPYLAKSHGLCDDESCSVQCYPVIWDRNLCQFYSQISSWRATAKRCSLTLPAPPTRDRAAPEEEQWLEARTYWDMVTELWRQAATDAGVLEDSDLSGSGMLTADPTDLTVPQATQASWMQQMSTWEEDYSQWNAFLQRTQSNSSREVILGLRPDEMASSVRSNSRDWSTLISDWSAAVDSYNITYSETCQ